MSDARKAAQEAPEIIEGLLVEMFEGGYPDNKVVLGTLGENEIQIHLVVTRDKSQFLDE